MTLDELIDAALAVGLGTFSVVELAARLKVSDGTIYNYVASRDRLYSLACARAFEAVDLAAPDRVTWDAYVEELCERVAVVVERHPGIYRYLAWGPYEPTTLSAYDRIVDEVAAREPGVTRGTAFVLASRPMMMTVSSLDVHAASHSPVSEPMEDALVGMLRWTRRAMIRGMVASLAEGSAPDADWAAIAATMRQPDADWDGPTTPV